MLSAVAPAKINLALHVTGQRADGHHLIETLCVFTDFGDRISIAPSLTDEFSLCGPYAGAIAQDGSNPAAANLVTLARDALRALLSARHDCAPVSITLEKNLPVSSGIGGGSSDAALALKMLAAHWPGAVGDSDLASIALSLGADVPMCLKARPLVARGIGEELEVALEFPGLNMVLVNPGVAVPTAQVFSRLARKANPPLSALPPSLSAQAIAGWLHGTRNDLQPPAMDIAPEIGVAIRMLQNAGAGFARMSGSGATVFGMFDSRAAAMEAQRTLAMQRPGWFVKAVETGGSMAG